MTDLFICLFTAKFIVLFKVLPSSQFLTLVVLVSYEEVWECFLSRDCTCSIWRPVYKVLARKEQWGERDQSFKYTVGGN